MAEEFKSGDVVRMKTGGPQMMVEDVVKGKNDRWRVHCEWFDASNVHQRSDIAVTSLERVQVKKSGPLPPA